MNFDPRINQLISKTSALHTSAGVTGAISATAATTAIVAVIILLSLPAAAVVAPIVALSSGGVILLALAATITLLYNKYTTLDRVRFLRNVNPQTCDSGEDNQTIIAQIESSRPSPSFDEDPLISLVKANDHDGVRDFLAKEGIGRSDIHLDERQNTPLIWASYKGHYEIVKMLIESGADVCRQSVQGMSVLMNGVSSGDKRIVQLLIDHGACVNSESKSGVTALRCAVDGGHADVVQILLENGANVNTTLNDDPLISPYVIALQKGHHQIAKMLKACLTSEELNVCQEALALNAVGHSTHQKGNLTFNRSNNGAPIDVELEGSSGSAYWLKKMIKCTELLLGNNSAPILQGEAKRLISLLESSALNSTDEAWTRYKNGQPSLILTGYSIHVSSALIWGPYFVLCDRGGKSGHPFRMYKFDPKQVDHSFFKQLLSLKSKDSESYSQFLKDWQPRLLLNSFGILFLKNFPFGMQKVGNCSMASIEGAVWAFLALNKLFSGKDGAFDETIKPQNSAITEALSQTTKEVCDWLLYYQIYLLERYVGVRVLRSQDPLKIMKSKSKRKRIELNYDFYTSTMDYLACELEKRRKRQDQGTTDEDPLENALLALSNGLSNVLQD